MRSTNVESTRALISFGAIFGWPPQIQAEPTLLLALERADLASAKALMRPVGVVALLLDPETRRSGAA